MKIIDHKMCSPTLSSNTQQCSALMLPSDLPDLPDLQYIEVSWDPQTTATPEYAFSLFYITDCGRVVSVVSSIIRLKVEILQLENLFLV